MEIVDEDNAVGDTLGTKECILEGSAKVSGKQYHILLNSNGLKLTETPKSNRDKDIDLSWQDVICAKPNAKQPKEEQNTTFQLYYVQQGKKNILRHICCNVQLKNDQAEKWIAAIQEFCSKVSCRPKKLFVLVNPIGGAGKGRQIFQKNVAPLFDLAGIETTVVVTEKSKHALEIGESQDFSQFDGLVVVGGDGLYQELLQGLTLQKQKKAGVLYDNPDVELQRLDKPIGIIPAGTGNGATGLVNGVIDAETAALNIIRGEHHRVEIFSVYSNAKFLCVCTIIFGYGMFSDMIKRTDELRWMKKARYPYSIAAMLCKKKRFFQAEISYRIQEIKSSSDEDSSHQHTVSDWIPHKNESKRYNSVFTMPCEILDAGSNKIMLNPFGDFVHLAIGTGCSHMALFKVFINMATGKKIDPIPPNLEIIERVTDFKINLVRDESASSESPANNRNRDLEHLVDIDGEVVQLEKPELEIRLRTAFVPLYGCKQTVKKD
ncbi:uncharacterized protein LOC131940601 [Physella acuta]|uniref:uncharacterized protein LOC131940601 n=1 Tax=Physella acuta TaxID=109671 RepID=UPI0027DCAAA5|nr:uncharacterized protein LOC131940601 [Physella acuta]